VKIAINLKIEQRSLFRKSSKTNLVWNQV